MGQSKITVRPDRVTGQLGDLYGIFFEDLNHAADGGLYAEMVQNRSFEFCAVDNPSYHPLMAWEKIEKKYSRMQWWIQDSHPYSRRNPHYLVCEIFETGMGAGVRNTGFTPGMYLQKGEKYRFSCLAATDGRGELPLRLVLENDEGRNLGQADIVVSNGTVWNHYEAEITAQETTTAGNLSIYIEAVGRLYLDMVSLFPQKTFMQQRNGLRADIATLLADLKPQFMRFPGGCLVHDGSINAEDRDSLYRWKNTIGVLEERPARRNNWGYNQTLGLGYYEYFCFCEDIGAKPLPVLPGGFNPHKGEGVPIEEIGAWVDDALDLIEFANGDASTKWGSIRAGLGHEKPFGLEYIGIGNEEIGEGFFERYPYFHEAIRKKYPSIRIINTAGPFAVGEGYDAGWTSAKKYGSDFIDEHYYSSPEWFMANMHHYDDYDASGTKVFLGEYATWGNTYYNALVEAAYMTHLEKAPVVGLACYAPMLANKDYVNWRPDMLFFDNHQVVKTANYHVQKLFMKNQGDYELKTKLEGFDEIIPLMDERNIAGSITLVGNDIVGKVWDVKLTDKETNACTLIEPFDITKESKDNIIKDIDSTHYELEFKFRRSEGRKGFKLLFGKRDEKNYIMWEFGGWDNWDCNISSFKNGRASTISHRIFHVTDEEYTLRLEIEGRRIRTYVDGILYNDTVDRLPQLEEIYVCASKDMNGRTIVKAVNLTGEEKNTVISIAGAYKSLLTVYQLSDCALTQENTFEQPDTIEPKKSVYQVENNEYQYIVKPHSVNILVFE